MTLGNRLPEVNEFMMTSSNGNVFRVTGPFCAGNSPVPGEFPAQRPVTRSFDVFFDLRPDKRLSKHWWGWWFETPSRPLWRHCNDFLLSFLVLIFVTSINTIKDNLLISDRFKHVIRYFLRENTLKWNGCQVYEIFIGYTISCQNDNTVRNEKFIKMTLPFQY